MVAEYILRKSNEKQSSLLHMELWFADCVEFQRSSLATDQYL